MPKLITTGEAATLLGVSRQTISRMLNRGDLAGYQFPNGTVRLDANELNAWLAARRTDGMSIAMEQPTPLGSLLNEAAHVERLHADQSDVSSSRCGMSREVAVNEDGLRIGEDHQNSKLTDGEVEIIRRLHEDGMTYGALAAKFEVSRWSIGRICRYERRAQTVARWKTIDTDSASRDRCPTVLRDTVAPSPHR